MKTYFFNIIPKLEQFSKKLDNISLLTSQHWVVIDNEITQKVMYIFRPNGDLLISQQGQVQKAKWEYLGNQSLLIEQGEKSQLFKHGFFNEQVLALQIDTKNEYAVLVAEQQYIDGINTLQAVHQLLDSLVQYNIEKQVDSQLNTATLRAANGSLVFKKKSLGVSVLQSFLIFIGIFAGVIGIILLFTIVG